MQAVTEYVSRRSELEGKIRELETEKASLLVSISSFKERIAEAELERSANALQNEVESLRAEKAALEEKASAYETQISYSIPNSVEGV